MKITEVYLKYKTPPGLQQHMLWSVAVGNVICTNWKEERIINTDLVTKTLLVHDMSSLIVFNLDKFPVDYKKYSHLLSPEQKNDDYWKAAQKEFIKKWGNDDHEAEIKIVKELGFEEKGIEILEEMPEVRLENKIPEDEWELKICWYADFRVAPYGVTSVEKRVDDLIKRQIAKGRGDEEIQRLRGIKEYCLSLEKQIQQNVKIDLALTKKGLIESTIKRIKQCSF